jgi:hypothetical protein
MIVAGLGGVALTALVTAVLVLAWGRAALVPGVTFGLLATAIQVVSAALVGPVAKEGEFKLLIRRWAIGMGLRVAGIAAFGAAVWIRRDLFPPLPTAFGYLGVVVPLLFMETRFLK